MVGQSFSEAQLELAEAELEQTVHHGYCRHAQQVSECRLEEQRLVAIDDRPAAEQLKQYKRVGAHASMPVAVVIIHTSAYVRHRRLAAIRTM